MARDYDWLVGDSGMGLDSKPDSYAGFRAAYSWECSNSEL